MLLGDGGWLSDSIILLRWRLPELRMLDFSWIVVPGVGGDPPPLLPAPLRVQGRAERMSADGRDGVGMRWVVLTPSPSPASLESLR